MAKYVDANGLLYVLQKMKAKFALKTEIPTVPAVGNGTVTVKKNGTAVDSFTTNQSADKDINITLAKADVGLGNVDNTSDANKPISTATQTALNGKAPTNHASTTTTYGAGTATDYGHVKLSDAIDGTEAAVADGTAATPKAVSDVFAAAKDYVDSLDTGVSSVKGDAEATYRTGDVNITKADIGLGNVDNTADANKSVASAAKLTAAAKIAGRKFDGTSDIVFSGKSTTAADTATKVVTLDTGGSISSIQDGTFLFVKFTYGPTNTSNMYLKIGENSWPVVDGMGNNITYNNKYIYAGRYSLFVRNTIADNHVWQVLPILSYSYSALTQAIATAGTETTGKLISAKVLHDSIVELLPTLAGVGETGLVRWDSSPTTPGNLIGISSLTSDSKPILTSFSGVGASFISGGTFDVARIPNLDAAKITSGTFSSDRIPSLPIGKLPTLSTLTDTSDATTVPTSKSVRTYVMGKMADVAGALVYRGTVGGSSATVSDLPASHTKGWYYIVKEAGTYAGEACEAGDMIICNNTGSAASNTDWDVVQSNIESMSNADIDIIWNQAFAA